MNEAQALQMLQMNPMEMLRKNSITPGTITQGLAPVAAGLYTYYMVKDEGKQIKRPGSIMGNLRTKTGDRFKILPASALGGAGFPFHALHIPVQPSNIPINAYPLSTVGSGLMITTQLTGCCIVMVPGGGTWSVAHVQPTKGFESGLELQTRLAGAGVKVYGINDYVGGGRAALIGVREGGGMASPQAHCGQPRTSE